MKENDIQPMSVFSVIKKMEEMHLHNILDTQFNMTFIAHIAHTMVQQYHVLKFAAGSHFYLNAHDVQGLLSLFQYRYFDF